MKNIIKYIFLFWCGGSIYIEIELLYRNYTHWSMFLLAGFVFITIGSMNELWFDWHDQFLKQIIIGTIWATLCEYICGNILRHYNLKIWDYSNLPFNIDGLICPQFMIAWFGLVIVAIIIDDLLKFYFFDGLRPHYHFNKWCLKLCPIEIISIDKE